MDTIATVIILSFTLHVSYSWTSMSAGSMSGVTYAGGTIYDVGTMCPNNVNQGYTCDGRNFGDQYLDGNTVSGFCSGHTGTSKQYGFGHGVTSTQTCGQCAQIRVPRTDSTYNYMTVMMVDHYTYSMEVGTTEIAHLVEGTQWVVGDRADFDFRIVGNWDCYASFDDNGATPSPTSSTTTTTPQPTQPTTKQPTSDGSGNCGVSSNWGSMKVNPYWGSTNSSLYAVVSNVPSGEITSFEIRGANQNNNQFQSCVKQNVNSYQCNFPVTEPASVKLNGIYYGINIMESLTGSAILYPLAECSGTLTTATPTSNVTPPPTGSTSSPTNITPSPTNFTPSPSDTTANPSQTTIVTNKPTVSPTFNPSKTPTNNPTYPPSFNPTLLPTETPTKTPTDSPIIPGSPTKAPSDPTTSNPSDAPTNIPTKSPTNIPTEIPTNDPISGSSAPTESQTTAPTKAKTVMPTQSQTVAPTQTQSVTPTETTTSLNPTRKLTNTPTNQPSSSPSLECDDTCDVSDDNKWIKIKVILRFRQWIVYDLTQIKCWLYKIFVKWFMNFEFVKYFDVCDIEIIIIGGKKNTDKNCINGPCLWDNGRRKLLQNSDVGNITTSIISEDENILQSLNGLSMESMSDSFSTEIIRQFGMELDVKVEIVEDTNKESENKDTGFDIANLTTYNNMAWIIFGIILFALIIFVIGLSIICYRKCTHKEVYTKKGVETMDMMGATNQTNIVSAENDYDEYDNDTAFGNNYPTNDTENVYDI